MHLTSQQLRSLTNDVDDLHHEGMRNFADEVADAHLDAVRASRRSVLIGSAAVVGAVAALTGPLFMPRSFIGTAAAQGLDDQTIAGYAQSVELAAVAAYTAAAAVLSAATLPVGKLFMSHHQQHADAFGKVAGDKAAAGPNKKLIEALTPTLQGIKDETGALEFAFILENQAAYTYAAALTLLQNPAYAAATATILPIEAQHAVVLGLALGKSVTDVFPTGAFESSALGDGTDPLKGLDPAAFAG
jgi:rubrerythrin